MEERLKIEPDLNVAATPFLCWLHKIFYDRFPERLRLVRDDRTGEVLEVIGGELREREVRVARHVGPEADAVPAFLERFADFYGSDRHHGIIPLIAAAASHHRLVWIHPFLDGNGRVARLYTDACFRRFALTGYGLWNVSRGLARRRRLHDGFYRGRMQQAAMITMAGEIFPMKVWSGFATSSLTSVLTRLIT